MKKFSFSTPEDKFEKKEVLERGSYGRIYIGEYVDEKKNMEYGELVLQSIDCQEIESLKYVMKELLPLMNLHHPNVILCHECFISEDDLVANIIMEYEKGTYVQEWFKIHRMIPETILYDLMEQVTSGLDFLHSSGFIHGHLCPRSLKIETVGNENKFKIVDICCPERMEEAGFSRSTNSYCYQAPELMAKMKFGGAADIWSLGVIIYNLMVKNDEIHACFHFYNNRREDINSDLVVRGYSQPFVDLVMRMIEFPKEDRAPSSEILYKLISIRKGEYLEELEEEEDSIKKLKTIQVKVNNEKIEHFPVNQYIVDKTTLIKQNFLINSSFEVIPDEKSSYFFNPDILIPIFQFSGVLSISKLCRVCKIWRTVSSMDILWKFFFTQKWGVKSYVESERIFQAGQSSQTTQFSFNGEKSNIVSVMKWRHIYFREHHLRKNLSMGFFQQQDIETGAINFTVDSKQNSFVLGTNKGRIWFYSRTGERNPVYKLEETIRPHHWAGIRGVIVLHDEGIVITASRDASIQIHSLHTHKNIFTEKKDRKVDGQCYSRLAFHKHSRTLFASGGKGIYTFHLQTSSIGQNIRASLTPIKRVELGSIACERIKSIRISETPLYHGKQVAFIRSSDRTLHGIDIERPFSVVCEIEIEQFLSCFEVTKTRIYMGAIRFREKDIRDLLIWKKSESRRRLKAQTYKELLKNEKSDLPTEVDKLVYVCIKKLQFRGIGSVQQILWVRKAGFLICGFSRGHLLAIDGTKEESDQFPVLWAKKVSEGSIQKMVYDGSTLFCGIWGKSNPLAVLNFGYPLRKKK